MKKKFDTKVQYHKYKILREVARKGWDGSIVDAEAVKSPHPALAAEALRVVKSMPKWKPAKEGGKVVRSRFNIPIMFRLAGKKPQSTSAQPQKPQPVKTQLTQSL